MAILSGHTERWLVEDCGKSRFAGAQKASWKHKALPRSLIIHGNRTPGVRRKNSWLSRGWVSTAEGTASLLARDERESASAESGGGSAARLVRVLLEACPPLLMEEELERGFPLRGGGCGHPWQRREFSQMPFSHATGESCEYVSFNNTQLRCERPE